MEDLKTVKSLREVESTFVENKENKDHLDVADVDSRIRRLAQDAPPFYRKHNLMMLYLLMIPGCLVPSVTLGFDSAMMNGLQAVETWNEYFDNPSGSILGLLTAILSLGAICATPFINLVGDRWGRRKGILFGSALMGIGGIIQGASVHIAMFLVSRFLVGFGLVFANTYAPILIGELSYPKDRQVATSLYETTWYLGATMAAWITYGTFPINNNWAWRIPSLLQAVPAIITTAFVLFLPESPRWLIANGQSSKAKEILIKYHAEGDENDELMQLEFMEMKQVIEADMMANEISWRSLLASKGNRRRMLLMVMLGVFSQWSGNGLVSYYLARVLDTVGISSFKTKNTINGCLMIWSWICSICSAFLTAHLRRRTQFLISTAGMLAIFASQTLCAGLFNETGDHAAGYAVIAMLFLFYTFYNLGFNALLYSYPVEVLPYSIRGKGFTVLMFFGKAANFINAFVNPIGLSAIGWKYYLVYVGWLVVENLGIYLYLVETKGPNLEAIASRFDDL